jgi:hypothetical protein
MPRFFFDYENGVALVVDPEGTELPDLAEARREAIDTLLHSAHDQMTAADNDAAMAISVRDEDGFQILKVTLALVISS